MGQNTSLTTVLIVVGSLAVTAIGGWVIWNRLNLPVAEAPAAGAPVAETPAEQAPDPERTALERERDEARAVAAEAQRRLAEEQARRQTAEQRVAAERAQREAAERQRLEQAVRTPRAPSLSGSWRATATWTVGWTGDAPLNLVFNANGTFEQTGSAGSGTWRQTGDEVTWTYTAGSTSRYRGRIVGNRITGTMDSGDGVASGTFVATRN